MLVEGRIYHFASEAGWLIEFVLWVREGDGEDKITNMDCEVRVVYERKDGGMEQGFLYVYQLHNQSRNTNT